MTLPDPLPTHLVQRLKDLSYGNGMLVVLTGAGISAESGIPTFRGPEGYWTVGSREYRPEQMATHAMFESHPQEVWAWYLYRRGVCRRAEPNAGHHAVVGLEERLGDQFRLITQNVDGLNLRAGNSPARTYQIHGNVDSARCDKECGKTIWQLDDRLGLGESRSAALTDRESSALRCPACGGWARPHVLWFDECYDEASFRWDSSIRAAESAAVLLVVGTSGATTLPAEVGRRAAEHGAFIVDVNVEANPFSRLAESTGGVALRGSSAVLLPTLLAPFAN